MYRPQCFFVNYMHMCPLYNVLLEVGCCCFPRNILLNMTFVRSRSSLSPPSFTFVSAAGSGICELNQNKKEKEKNNSKIGYFDFNTFPAHIIHQFLKQRYL